MVLEGQRFADSQRVPAKGPLLVRYRAPTRVPAKGPLLVGYRAPTRVPKGHGYNADLRTAPTRVRVRFGALACVRMYARTDPSMRNTRALERLIARRTKHCSRAASELAVPSALAGAASSAGLRAPARRSAATTCSAAISRAAVRAERTAQRTPVAGACRKARPPQSSARCGLDQPRTTRLAVSYRLRLGNRQEYREYW